MTLLKIFNFVTVVALLLNLVVAKLEFKISNFIEYLLCVSDYIYCSHMERGRQ